MPDNGIVGQLRQKMAELEGSFLQVQDQNRLLSERLEESRVLYKIAAMLNSTHDMVKLHSIIKAMLGEITFVDQFALMSREDQKDAFTPLIVSEKRKTMADVIALENKLAEKVHRSQRFEYFTDLGKFGLSKGHKKGGLLAFPFFSSKKTNRVLCYFSKNGMTAGEIEFLAVISGEVAVAIERVLIYHETLEISIKDELTQIFNRRYFNDRSHRELNRARRHKHALSFIIMDIDHFKNFNDTYGHAIGDEVLKWVAQQVQLGLRDTDILARYGGEEFMIILPETEKEGAVTVAEKVRKLVDKNSTNLTKKFDSPIPIKRNITISLGVAQFEVDGDRLESLLEKADERLYKAKVNGRNQVCAS